MSQKFSQNFWKVILQISWENTYKCKIFQILLKICILLAFLNTFTVSSYNRFQNFPNFFQDFIRFLRNFTTSRSFSNDIPTFSHNFSVIYFMFSLQFLKSCFEIHQKYSKRFYQNIDFSKVLKFLTNIFPNYMLKFKIYKISNIFQNLYNLTTFSTIPKKCSKFFKIYQAYFTIRISRPIYGSKIPKWLTHFERTYHPDTGTQN